MNCKHDWHFVEGAEHLQCKRCGKKTATTIDWSRFAIPAEQLQQYKLHDSRPNNLLFYGQVNGQQTEVMRISKDGILVNPDVPVDEAAKKVLEAIDHNIKWMVEQVRKEEREAIAQMIESAPPLAEFAKNDKGGCLVCGFTPKLAAASIRARKS